MKLSIIIPTYNGGKILKECLESIYSQDYPKENYEVLIVDGRSSDNTREIAKKFPVKLIDNPARVEEPARINAIKMSNAEIVALVDQDNIFVGKDFLRKMMEPFKDPEIMYADSLYYGFRKSDAPLVRYMAMIGGDDPIATYLGAHSRWCYYKNNWTDYPIKVEKKKGYEKVWIINKEKIPPVGSNGFFVRRKMFWPYIKDKMIHPDFIWRMVKDGHNCMAKVDGYLIQGQVALFRNKIRRLKRRIKNEVKTEYHYDMTPLKIFKVTLLVITIIPLIIDMIKGFIRKPDSAWLYHIPASIGLFFIYAYYKTRERFKI